MKKIVSVFILITSLLFALPAIAAQPSWNEWVYQLKLEAVDDGISPALFDEVFQGLTPNDRVTNFQQTQPERRLTFLEYRDSRASKYRIQMGQDKFHKHAKTLKKIGEEYGVNHCYIAAIWGLETSYGSFMGSFPVIRSLATLAYRGNRQAYFRQELLFALHVLNEGHVNPKDYKGEWAGASGQVQFMPSSFLKFAQDYNGDGRKDLWNTLPDAFASVANYLKSYGWERDQPWGMLVKIPYGLDRDLVGLETTRTVDEWAKLGVRQANDEKLPISDLQASLLEPYGDLDLLVFNNFRVLMKYNNSVFYAGTVSYMADKICQSESAG